MACFSQEKTVPACALNNAQWCEAVLKAAGAGSAFHGDFWVASGRQLPLYPNLVTLQAGASADLHAALDALPAGAAVKDSYDCLDLGPFGFDKLFSGAWLFRPVQADRRPPAAADWHKARTADHLKAWRAAWCDNKGLHDLFPVTLLEDPRIDFAAIVRGGTVRSGVVISRGPRIGGKDVIGLSNLFGRRNWLYGTLHDLLEPFPHLPVCTYEADDARLPVYRQLGFLEVGRLSVWVKTETGR